MFLGIKICLAILLSAAWAHGCAGGQVVAGYLTSFGPSARRLAACIRIIGGGILYSGIATPLAAPAHGHAVQWVGEGRQDLVGHLASGGLPLSRRLTAGIEIQSGGGEPRLVIVRMLAAPDRRVAGF